MAISRRYPLRTTAQPAGSRSVTEVRCGGSRIRRGKPHRPHRYGAVFVDGSAAGRAGGPDCGVQPVVAGLSRAAPAFVPVDPRVAGGRPTATISTRPSPFRSPQAMSSVATPLSSITCFCQATGSAAGVGGPVDVDARPAASGQRVAEAEDQLVGPSPSRSAHQTAWPHLISVEHRPRPQPVAVDSAEGSV